MATERHIYITEQDLKRLEALMASASRQNVNIDALEEELGRAIVVKSTEIPPDVVTMNSKIRFKDEDSDEASEVTLVYPHEADPSAGKISVLAPVGSALLGLSVGQSIEWPMPNGKTRSFRILSVLFQPEASGRFDL